MNNTSTLGWRIIGALVGLLAGSVLVLLVFVFTVEAVAGPISFIDMSPSSYIVVYFGPVAALLGATLGSVAGATITQRILGWRCSLWRAFLAALVGMVGGIPCLLSVIGIPMVPILIVAGAVLGSGWKTKPAKATGSPS